MSADSEGLVPAGAPVAGFERSPASVRRFTLFKWGTAVVLALLLLAFGLGGQGDQAETGAGPLAGAGSGAGSGAGADPSLVIQRGEDGRLRVRGVVGDETTRDLWLNAIRIGAQGVPVVVDDMTVGPVISDSPWSPRLSTLVALFRERQLSGLRIDADRLSLEGAVSGGADREETDRIFAAQLPPGFRLDSRVVVAGSQGGPRPAGPASAGGGATGRAGGASIATPGAPVADAGGAAAGSTTTGPSLPSGSAGAAGTADNAGTAGTPRAPAPAAATEAASASAATSATASAAASAAQPAAAPAAAAPRTRPSNCPKSMASLTGPIYFRTDAAEIGNADRARLQRLGQCLWPRNRLRVIGYADPRHTDEYNKVLSEQRARSVAAEIIVGGVPAERITVVGAGKVRAGSRAESAAALQRSRRVDILIR